MFELKIASGITAIFCAWTLAGFPPPQEPGRKLDLFLLVGQSNMAGRGTVEAQDRAPIPEVFAWGKEARWSPAVDPLHWDKPEIAGVGLGRGFAQQMLRAHPNSSIGLIPAAFGGTSLEQWAVGGKLYTDALARARGAMKSGVLRGILWHQGEAECGKEELARTYVERWTPIMESLRKDLGAPDVPVVVGELGQFLEHDKQPFAAVVNEQLKSIPLHVKNTGFAASTGLTDRGDHLHFDSASQREFGRRYAAVFLQLAPH